MAILTEKIKKVKSQDQSIVDLWKYYSVDYANIDVVIDKYSNIKLTYREFYEKIKLLSGGLQYLGLNKGEHICLFSENSAKWLLSDQAVLFAGGVNAVRGSAASAEELEYILEHSDSIGLIAENFSVISKLKNSPKFSQLKFVIILSNDETPENVYNLDKVIELGKTNPYKPVEIQTDDLATLIYTSGTTGRPKGVMLSHKNLLSQVKAVNKRLFFEKGKTVLSVLPTWHSYERTAEYFLLSCGLTLTYTNLLNLKDDIKKTKPDYFISVPRIWEAFYNGILTELEKQPAKKKKFIQNLLKISEKYIKSKRIAKNFDVSNVNPPLISRLNAAYKALMLYPFHKFADKAVYSQIRFAFGGNLQQGITGGGAIARHLDDFYEIIGINVINGYGLTETSPILAANSLEKNLRGSVGRPLDKTELRIVDPEIFTSLGRLKTGVVMAKGPQVMKGYYKNSEETEKILSDDGWINTGDLGWITDNGELVLTGRAKDIIVLSNGENIEPYPIEEACLKSPLIEQIMLVGQDKASLGALVVPHSGIKHHNSAEVQKLFKQELTNCVQSRKNFRPFERIQYFRLLEEPFTVDNGLMTQTMKLKKNEIQKRYASLIEEMFR